VPRDLNIANKLRAANLRVVECAGWPTRGSSDFNPRGSVNHHTAGSSKGKSPSLNGVIHGHPGSASGPLAHALQSREPDGNDIFYVVASGRANHAGQGGWKGLSGNSSVYGLEIEHTGVDPLPEGRQKLAARFHAALARGTYSESMVCQHREWAPRRKIDAATQVDANRFRGWVADYMKGSQPSPSPTPPPKPVEEVEMWVISGEVISGKSKENAGVLQIGLPYGFKTARVDLYVDCDPSNGQSTYSTVNLSGKNHGLWSGGNKWELWIPGRKPMAATLPASAKGVSIQNWGGAGVPVLVTVSGT
jgi:N-acetylmuramoyl-L-alanine amidase